MSSSNVTTSVGDNSSTAPNYFFSCRVDRPIQGCELTPNPFLQLKGTSVERPRMVDPNIYTISFQWKRGPKKPACVHPSCTRANSFEPTQWSKAALGGPELICNVCTKAGFPPHESSFCSRKCFISAWKEHSKRHINIKKPTSDEDNEQEPDDSLTTTVEDSCDEWMIIAEGKTYTPTVEDVGCRIRIEVSAIATLDNSVMAGPIALYTEPVLSAPGRPPKRSLQTIPGSGSGISGAVRFRVVSYNILAELFATKQAYPYCDVWNLAWPYRRKILLEELEEMQGDVVCLQEVQADHYEADINPFMLQLGYDGIYKPKSREFGISQYAKVDGCATFWKKNKFMMTENYCLEFNDMARQEASTMGFDELDARKFMNRLNRDNIAQIVVLESLTRSARGGRNLLCVVNTHLYSNHQRPDVKLWQTMNLVREIQNFVSTRDLALMICGDFNSEPHSAVYEYVTRGSLHTDFPELNIPYEKGSVRVLPDVHNIVHEMTLASAMDSTFNGEPVYTNYTGKFKGTLDYIFYSPNRLRIMAATSIPDEEDIRTVAGEGLPCACYPSDHILLCCDVAMIISGNGSIINPEAVLNHQHANNSGKMLGGNNGKNMRGK